MFGPEFAEHPFNALCATINARLFEQLQREPDPVLRTVRLYLLDNWQYNPWIMVHAVYLDAYAASRARALSGEHAEIRDNPGGFRSYIDQITLERMKIDHPRLYTAHRDLEILRSDSNGYQFDRSMSSWRDACLLFL